MDATTASANWLLIGKTMATVSIHCNCQDEAVSAIRALNDLRWAGLMPADICGQLEAYLLEFLDLYSFIKTAWSSDHVNLLERP